MFSIAISTCLSKMRNYGDYEYTYNPHDDYMHVTGYTLRDGDSPHFLWRKHLQCTPLLVHVKVLNAHLLLFFYVNSRVVKRLFACAVLPDVMVPRRSLLTLLMEESMLSYLLCWFFSRWPFSSWPNEGRRTRRAIFNMKSRIIRLID